MNPRIQRALDGEIDPFHLSVLEREELRQAESEIDAVLGAIPAHQVPDLAPAVLARIRQRNKVESALAAVSPRSDPRPARPPLVEWLWRPRSISFGLRPAYALAAAVFAVVLGIQALRPSQHAAQVPQVFTRFVLRAPDASQVSLAGDFTGWQPSYSMTRSGPEVWTVVVPLEPGVHTYAFVIDGQRWIADPMAPAIADGFGGVNSRVAVLTPDARKL